LRGDDFQREITCARLRLTEEDKGGKKEVGRRCLKRIPLFDHGTWKKLTQGS